MAKTIKAEEAAPEPTFAFHFYQSKTDPKEWTSSYSRHGKVVFEITAPNSYQYNAAVMEMKLRLAIHEG